MKDLKEVPKKYLDKRYDIRYFKYRDTQRFFTGKLSLIEKDGKIYDKVVSSITELEEIYFAPQFKIRFGIVKNQNGGVLVEDLEDNNFMYLFSLSGFLNGLKRAMIKKVGKYCNEFSANVRIKKRFDSYFIEPFKE